MFAYFLTESVGLSAAQMGLVLAVGFLISAGIDIAMGAGLNRLMADPRTASRLQFVGAILCSVALPIVFLGAWVPLDIRFPFALGAGLAFRLAFATYDIAQNALMALATTDPVSRLRVASTRIWFSGAATLIVAAMVGSVIKGHGSADGTRILLAMAALFSVVAIGSAWMLSRILEVARLAAQAAGRSGPGQRGTASLLDFGLLLLIMLATAMLTPAFAKLEPYFAAYGLRSAYWGGVLVAAMALGIVAGQPVWIWLSKRMAPGAVMLLAAGSQLIALTAFWMIGVANPAGTAVAALAFGLGNGGVGMMQWAVFSEIVVRLGPARAGVSYGVFGAASKLGLGASGLLLAVVLAGTDFRTHGSELVAPMAAIPALGALCCAAAAIGLLYTQRLRRI